MVERGSDDQTLARTLIDTWAAQGRDGFLLTAPAAVRTPPREVIDPSNGISFRFRWMPHREHRGNVSELERRGILNPRRSEARLFRDDRDPAGRHCFLCASNIRECHPKEILVPIELADRSYFAGANFAWIASNHFTVMATDHVDQTYSLHVLEAAVELHRRTAGQFRVLYNGLGAGATIPWHLHLQITTAPMPIEALRRGDEGRYPTAVWRFVPEDDGLDKTHAAVRDWLERDPTNHSVNLLVATIEQDATIFVFPRDQRRASARGKGLVGGFEVAGDFVLSAPLEEATFVNASATTARDILRQVRPSV